MPVLYRYLLRLFLEGVARILGIFVGLFFLLDGAEQIRRSTGEVHFYWHDVVTMLLLRLPGFLVQFLPAIVLLSTMMVLNRLSRHNEITVIRAGGISIYRVLIPFMLGGLLVAALQFAVQDQVVTRANRAAEALIQKIKVTGLDLPEQTGRSLWLRDGHQIIHAGQASAHNHALLDVTVFQFDDAFQLVGRMDARSARLEQGRWFLLEGAAYRMGEGNLFTVEHFQRLPWHVELAKEALTEATPHPEALSSGELRAFARRLHKEGYDATPYQVMWQRKLADPFTTLAAILLAFPFSLRLHRMGGTGRMLLMGLMTGFALFIVVDLSTALGMGGRLPPLLAAWAPVLFFSGMGGFLLMHLEEDESAALPAAPEPAPSPL